MQAAQIQDWQAKHAAKEAAITFAAQQLQAANPHLVPNEGNSLVAAAKNIRIELARAFPSVKFTVRTKRFSMGNDIRVEWIDGPTTQQVDSIIQRYSSGTFDGMTDCYEYRDDQAFTKAFGSSKYIFATREHSDKMLASVIGRVCRYLGGVDRSVEQCIADWKVGKLWNVKTSGGCDLSREVSVALSKHTYCLGNGS